VLRRGGGSWSLGMINKNNYLSMNLPLVVLFLLFQQEIVFSGLSVKSLIDIEAIDCSSKRFLKRLINDLLI